MAKYTVYDIETLINLNTFCFKDFETNKEKHFIIHESQNDLDQLVKFLMLLKKNDYYLVGFNNLFFDSQVIQYILVNYSVLRVLTAERVANLIYREAQRIISIPEKDRFNGNLYFEHQLSIKQIDLYKQKHYDGKAKRTSLKWLEFTMRMNDIQEMPLPHDEKVSYRDIEKVLRYNKNDVNATCEFFRRNLFETELRLKLSEQFDLNLLNASEPRMSREILAKLLAKDMGIDIRDLKAKRTFRNEIHLGKCIIPSIKFADFEFLDLVKRIKATTINANNTKNCFEYSVSYKGIDIYYGVGGVHGARAGVYESDKDYVIKTVDVTSFYPKMIIEYGFAPEHLGETFANRYNWFFTERKKYGKKDPINYIYKIILNSTYGLSNDVNSFLYDPLTTMKTTINGQLLLSMLAESLSSLENSQLIMLNTDGLEIKIPRKLEQQFQERCKEWETITRLNLEHDEYEKIIIADVNNYISIFSEREAKTKEEWENIIESDSFCLNRFVDDRFYYSPVKLKGRFEIKLDYHKNPSDLIVRKAIYEHFVKGVKVEDTINNADNIHDFCFGIKKKYDFELVLHEMLKGEHLTKKQQKVCRFYASTDGGKLLKEFNDGREVGVLTSSKVTIANYIEDPHCIPDNLSRNFYIKQALSEINSISGNIDQIKLF